MSAPRLERLGWPILAFVFTFLAGGAVLLALELSGQERRREETRALAQDRATAIGIQLNQTVSVLYALEALVRQAKGDTTGLDAIAEGLLSRFRGLRTLELQPGGVITFVHPREGNENAFGKNVLTDPQNGALASFAIHAGRVVLTDPIELFQGGQGVVARWAIHLPSPDGGRVFWGFAAATIRLKDVLDESGLFELEKSGYAFTLTKSEGTGRPGVAIAGSASAPPKDPVLVVVELPDGVWDLRVAPKGGWGNPLVFVAGLVLALLLASLAGYAALAAGNTARARESAESANAALASLAAELAESERRFRGIFDTMPDGYLRAGLTGEIQVVNPAAARILGYADAKELVGRDMARDVYEKAEDREALRSLLTGTGRVEGYELRFRRKDGSLVWIEDNAQLVRAKDGTPVAVEGSIRDITERKAAAAELERAREIADAANRAKSAFLATMSHEIRTPLNAIINMAELTLEGDLAPRKKQYVSTIVSSGRSLLALINDILDFSKIEAEKLELEEAPFSLRDLLEEVTEIFRAKVVEKHVELIVLCDAAIPAAFLGDALRLKQVLINLVGNAFKFTEKGEVSLRVRPSGERLRFSVSDTGIGIPRDQQAKLFSAFTQADSSTTRRYGGTGLGLAISKRLTGMMGGELVLESEEGKGTTFSFEIALPAVEGAPARTRDLPGRFRSSRALVVEDNATSLELVTSILDGFGMRSVAAASGERALELLSNERCDVVLLDWVLPGMNGLETARRIKESPAGRHLPVVVMSSYAGAREQAEARALGVEVFLPKPLTPSTLFDALVESLGLVPPRTEPEAAAPNLSGEFAGARVLLAEDNEANVFVARELLEPLGLALDVAPDGRAAVKMALKSSYDAILMDMQMPVMDGLRATKTLRAAGHLTPIIAMTANALRGDAEACLAAGMTDYVAKPVERAALVAALRRAIHGDAPHPAPAPAPATVAGPHVELPGVETAKSLERLGISWASYRKLLLRFAASEPATLAALEKAIEAGDRESARRHAHSLGGAAGTVGAADLAHSAKALELALRDGRETSDALEALTADVRTRSGQVFAGLGALAAPDGGGDPAGDPDA
ncbi:MAG: response regulator [Acidobacteria bacterium]|nr:response regulator [Acidobacteriota bacterium]